MKFNLLEINGQKQWSLIQLANHLHLQFIHNNGNNARDNKLMDSLFTI